MCVSICKQCLKWHLICKMGIFHISIEPIVKYINHTQWMPDLGRAFLQLYMYFCMLFSQNHHCVRKDAEDNFVFLLMPLGGALALNFCLKRFPYKHLALSLAFLTYYLALLSEFIWIWAHWWVNIVGDCLCTTLNVLKSLVLWRGASHWLARCQSCFCVSFHADNVLFGHRFISSF